MRRRGWRAPYPAFGQAGWRTDVVLWCLASPIAREPMSEHKPKRSLMRSLPVALGVGVLAGGLGYLLGKLGKASVPASLAAGMDALNGWDLLALPLIILLVLAVHEGGHLAGGMSRGMRFLLFIVGPFGWMRGKDGIRFRWILNLSTFGGLAAAIPAPEQQLKPQLIRLVLGGPLASLLLATMALAAAWCLPGRASAYGLIVAVMSLGIFVVTAIPMRSGGFMSDGMQFLQLSRNPAMVDRRVRLTALMGQGMAGTRPRDYDANLLAQAQAMTGEEKIYDVGVWLCSYFHAIDSGDVVAAAGWLDRIESAFDDYPDGFRQSLAIELALYEARYRRRLDVAQAWMARARGGMVDASRRSLAQAALAHLQGRRDKVLAELDVAKRRLGQSMDAGVAQLTADQIEALQRELETAA